MARRKWALLAAVVGGVVGACLVLAFWPFGAISPLNYHRIRLGMASDEVERIFGLPPGVHQTRPTLPPTLAPGTIGFKEAETGLVPTVEPPAGYVPGKGMQRLTYKQWWGDDYAIGVYLDEDGAVVGKCLISVSW
jgi:hypothetical protein